MKNLSLTNQRLILLIILFIILLYNFTSELVAVNNGVGWDGIIYYSVIKDFESLIINHGIDSYHMTRTLPFVIIHYALEALGIDINETTAVIGSRVYNFLLIILLVIYFFKISKVLMWDQKSELLAFSFVFFNFPVLKFFGYNPVSCDCTALVLSYIAVYYYLRKNKVAQTFIGLMSLVVWPILSAIIFILVLFPCNSVEDIDNSDKRQMWITRLLRLAFISFIPVVSLSFMLIIKFRHPDLDLLHFYKIINRGSLNLLLVLLSLLSVSVFYYFSTKILYINWIGVFKSILDKHILIPIALSGFLFAIIYSLIGKLGGEAGYSSMGQFLIMLKYPATDIFIFLETHFIYLGLFFLLVLFCWQDIVSYVRTDFGIGYYLLLILALMFIMDIETRKLESFYPLFLIPLIHCLRKKNIKWNVAFMIPIICLILSFFWFHINVPGIEDAFNEHYSNYWKFPAQRYYMFHGPWQSHIVYFVTITAEIAITFAIWILYKKGLLTSEK